MAGDPTPEAELIAARLRMQRRIAALIVSALAESGLSYEDVDDQLNQGALSMQPPLRALTFHRR